MGPGMIGGPGGAPHAPQSPPRPPHPAHIPPQGGVVAPRPAPLALIGKRQAVYVIFDLNGLFFNCRSSKVVQRLFRRVLQLKAGC